jgi:hypothetical protein
MVILAEDVIVMGQVGGMPQVDLAGPAQRLQVKAERRDREAGSRATTAAAPKAR